MHAPRTRVLAAWLAGLVVAPSVLPSSARADTLDEVRARGELVWGADQEGGGPYVYPRDDDPSRVTGFEVDLAERLAGELGVRARFFQGNWDKLPDLLRARQIDVVLNGYEQTAERSAVMRPTAAYYVYGLHLLARRDRPTTWETLAGAPNGPRPRVGVLGGSAAEAVVRERLGGAVELVSYDGNTDAMREVETGKLDATVQDTPIVAFYGPRFPDLVPAGPPIAPGRYVMYVRHDDERLAASLSAALAALHGRGELERLYRSYGLWDDHQAALADELGPASSRTRPSERTPAASPLEAASEPDAPIRASPKKRGLAVVADYGLVLLESAGVTVLLSVCSFPIAVALGLFVALGRLYGPRALGRALGVAVEVLRGTPLMLQLYFLFFLLPELGLRLPAFATAIAGLSLNYAAYESEIYRAGIGAVPSGQLEAALALGMSRRSALRHVIVPQATRVALPPMVNDFIALFKDTSVCSVVTIVELTKRYSVLNMSTQATIELTAMTALLYLAMSWPLSALARRLERRLGAEGGGA